MCDMTGAVTNRDLPCVETLGTRSSSDFSVYKNSDEVVNSEVPSLHYITV